MQPPGPGGRTGTQSDVAAPGNEFGDDSVEEGVFEAGVILVLRAQKFSKVLGTTSARSSLMTSGATRLKTLLTGTPVSESPLVLGMRRQCCHWVCSRIQYLVENIRINIAFPIFILYLILDLKARSGAKRNLV